MSNTKTKAALESLDTIKYSKEEWDKVVKQHTLNTVSSQIRFLHAEGYKKSPIAKFLGKRYQHVRNVLTQPIKKA